MTAWIFAFGLGAVAVLQGGLNRLISEKLSLGATVLLNALVFLTVALVYWFFAERSSGQSGLSGVGGFKPEWWYLIPGVLGAIFVFGIPWAIPQIGALRVFLCIVAGQMVVSIIWDKLAENRSPDLQGVLGALLAVAGVVVASWKKI